MITKKDKKGISGVVSTVLIILLVVAVIAVLGMIIFISLRNAKSGVNNYITCEDIDITPVKCTYDNYSDFFRANVFFERGRTATTLNVDNLTFVFDNENGETSVRSTDKLSIKALETKNAVFDVDKKPLGFTLSATIPGENGKIFQCNPSTKKVDCKLNENTYTLCGKPGLEECSYSSGNNLIDVDGFQCSEIPGFFGSLGSAGCTPKCEAITIYC